MTLPGFDPKWRDFPYTVEYSYRIEYKGILASPAWKPYRDFNTAIEKSLFSIRFPDSNPVRYLEQNVDFKRTGTMEGSDSVIIPVT